MSKINPNKAKAIAKMETGPVIRTHKELNLNGLFVKTVAKYRELATTKAQAEKEIATLRTIIMDSLTEAGDNQCLTPEHRVTMTLQTRRKLSKQRLFEAGVTVDQINAGMEETISPMLTVRYINEETSEEASE